MSKKRRRWWGSLSNWTCTKKNIIIREMWFDSFHYEWVISIVNSTNSKYICIIIIFSLFPCLKFGQCHKLLTEYFIIGDQSKKTLKNKKIQWWFSKLNFLFFYFFFFFFISFLFLCWKASWRMGIGASVRHTWVLILCMMHCLWSHIISAKKIPHITATHFILHPNSVAARCRK